MHDVHSGVDYAGGSVAVEGKTVAEIVGKVEVLELGPDMPFEGQVVGV